MTKFARSMTRAEYRAYCVLRGLIFFLIPLFLVIGCAAQAKSTKTTEAIKKIKKVAVLPFNNITGQREAGKIVTNVFVTEMFKSGRFHVEEPGNVFQFMIQERIDTIGEIEVERAKILGRRLNVDAVIVGTVEEFDDGRGGAFPSPVVSITARMIESDSGMLIWAAQKKKKGDDYIIILDFGEVRSASALTQKIVREMIETIK